MTTEHSHPLQSFRFCPCCGSALFVADGPRSKKCADCGFQYFFNPAAAVAALVTDGQGRLLLTRRACNPQKGTLDLPGGFAELDETLEDALLREVGEELGVEIGQLRYFASQPNRYPYNGLTVHTLDVFFTARLVVPDIELRVADDVDGFVWLHPDEIDVEKIGLLSVRAVVGKWKNEQLERR